MVMMIEPIDKCITKLKSERNYDEVIYMTPDGETLTQGIANHLSLKENIIILCGHYKGVDQTLRDHLLPRDIPTRHPTLSAGEPAPAALSPPIPPPPPHSPPTHPPPPTH